MSCSNVVAAEACRMSWLWQMDGWSATQKKELRRALESLRRKPNSWPMDVVIDAAHLVLTERMKGLVLLSIVEASLLLEGRVEPDELVKALGEERMDDLRSARVIGAVCSNRQHGHEEDTGWHFFAVLFDKTCEGSITAYYAESLHKSDVAADITREMLSSLGSILGVDAAQLFEGPFCVPRQLDGWSCGWRSLLAVEHGTRGLLGTEGRLPALSVMEEVITASHVVATRDAAIERIGQVGDFRGESAVMGGHDTTTTPQYMC